MLCEFRFSVFLKRPSYQWLSRYDVVAEKTNIVDAIKPPSIWELGAIQAWLLELAADLSDAPNISPEVDLFKQGFDRSGLLTIHSPSVLIYQISLNATFLRLRILGALRSAKAAVVQKAALGITQNLIYSYPTIIQLSTFLTSLISGTLDGNTVDSNAEIKAMITKYTADFKSPLRPITSEMEESVVLLIGSTGSLGSQILASLLKDARVKKVYAFNRPSPQAHTLSERHRAVFEDRGLDSDLLSSSKLSLVEGQINEKNLGLAENLYTEVRFQPIPVPTSQPIIRRFAIRSQSSSIMRGWSISTWYFIRLKPIFMARVTLSTLHRRVCVPHDSCSSRQSLRPWPGTVLADRIPKI